MIDMHAHWRPADLADALRARTTEPRILRNQDGVEVLKTRMGEEPVAKAFDEVGFHLGRMDRQGVSTSVLSLLGSFCWIEAQPPDVSLQLCRRFNDGVSRLCQEHEAASSPTRRCRWWTCQLAAAEFERALGLPGIVGAQVPGNAFLTRKDAEAMRPLLEVANRHRAVVFIHHGPRPGDTFPKVSADTDNARRRNGTLDMQASLSSVMVTLCLTDYLAPYPDAMIHIHNLGGNIPYEVERMDHRCLLDTPKEELPSARFRRSQGVRGLQLVRPARDRGRGAPVRRRSHRVRHRRHRVRLRVDQQGARGGGRSARTRARRSCTATPPRCSRPSQRSRRANTRLRDERLTAMRRRSTRRPAQERGETTGFVVGGPNGIRTRVSALRGPCPGPLDDGAGLAKEVAGGGGFEPPLPGPEPGVLPLDDPPPTRPTAFTRYHSASAASIGLQRAARLEARDLRGRDRDLLARARIVAVARGALGHAEGAEAADRHAPAVAERLEDATRKASQRAIGRGSSRPRGLAICATSSALVMGTYFDARDGDAVNDAITRTASRTRRRERLLDHRHVRVLRGTPRVGVRRVAGDEDEAPRQRGVVRDRLAVELVAVAVRHADVRDDQIVAARLTRSRPGRPPGATSTCQPDSFSSVTIRSSTAGSSSTTSARRPPAAGGTSGAARCRRGRRRTARAARP